MHQLLGAHGAVVVHHIDADVLHLLVHHPRHDAHDDNGEQKNETGQETVAPYLKKLFLYEELNHFSFFTFSPPGPSRKEGSLWAVRLPPKGGIRGGPYSSLFTLHSSLFTFHFSLFHSSLTLNFLSETTSRKSVMPVRMDTSRTTSPMPTPMIISLRMASM